MEARNTVEIKVTPDDVIAMIAKHLLLADGETWKLVKEYPTLGEYTFRILKEEENVNEDEK